MTNVEDTNPLALKMVGRDLNQEMQRMKPIEAGQGKKRHCLFRVFRAMSAGDTLPLVWLKRSVPMPSRTIGESFCPFNPLNLW